MFQQSVSNCIVALLRSIVISDHNKAYESLTRRKIMFQK